MRMGTLGQVSAVFLAATVLTAAGPAPGDELIARFREPLPDFSPVPIWWWSGERIEPDRLVRQLERIAAGGIRNVIILNLAPSGPLYGSAADDPPFLSEAWWDLFRLTVEVGERLGVRIWFYDQLGFSGAGLQARLVRDHPEFRGIRLEREVRDVVGPVDVELRPPPGGEALAAFLARPARLDPATANLPPAQNGSLGQPFEQVRDITTQLVDQTLRLRVPEGPYRVQLFYTMPGGFDYQNPAAGRALLEVVHGQIEKRFPGALGRTIAGSFQDEFPPLPRISRIFWSEFSRRCHYDLLPRLPALYDDIVDRFGEPNGPTTAMIRCDAARVAAELCEEAFFQPLFAWHEKHGMICGYDQTIRNGDPVASEGYYVDYWRTMRHFAAPGNDHFGDSKPHQSIAELYGRPRVWFEAFHSSGWGQTLEEIATLLHPWYCDGATLYNPHAIYYSTYGSFWEWAPPDTGWRQPYFVHYRELADYVARLSFILSQGRHVNQVALLYPSATVHAFTGFGPPLPAAAHANEVYWAIQNSLRGQRLDYLIIDEESIQRAVVAEGRLRIREAAFTLIFLPGVRALEGATLERLVAFAESGGHVVIVEPAPSLLANTGMTEEVFAGLGDRLRARMILLDDPARAADMVLDRLGRDPAERLPALHRRIGDRDFYFVLSDDGTPIGWKAMYEINHRSLHQTPAARGARLEVTLGSDGVPEQWDAATGRVHTLHHYQRRDGRTRVQIELTATPAPLIALRPAAPGEPLGIESDLQVLSVQRIGPPQDIVRALAVTRWDATAPPVREHRIEVRYPDAVYVGLQAARPPVEMTIDGPLPCELLPTCENRDGCFAWPPHPGPIPVEVRAFRYRPEGPEDSSADWSGADHDDASWETVLASYGPRAEAAGPLSLPAGQGLDSLTGFPAEELAWRPVEYSLRLGINEDPIYPRALGGKGRIPEEFIDLGTVGGGEVYLVRTFVSLPPGADREERPAVLRVGGEARKRVWLNGREVRFEIDSHARILRAPAVLQPGVNRLEIAAAREGPGSLRLFYHFIPSDTSMPDPQWIWTPAGTPPGRVLFSRTVEVPGEIRRARMVLALGDVHKLRINGQLVADQGHFDPYFTSRSEHYEVTGLFRSGANTVEIESHESGTPVGLIMDGLVELADGREIWFVSDQHVMVVPTGTPEVRPAPARILAHPAHGYLGETAMLLLRPRPHPLPQAGWLLDQPPPPPPFDALVFAATPTPPPPAWYRFRLPPGAVTMTLSPAGPAKLYVNGQSIPLRAVGDRYQATLPDPQAEKRIAALRIVAPPGYARGAALISPISFEVGPGRIPLGNWADLGLPHYAGGIRYTAELRLPDVGGALVWLDLGRVRGSVDVALNGKPCGTRIWHPYRFDLTPAARQGVNRLEIRLYNTLGPHFGIGHPSGHVFDTNQLVSGLFGPLRVRLVEPLQMTLLRETETPGN